MSTCPDTDLYSAYVDGEIPSPWKEKIEKHLSGCEKCRRIEKRYRQLHDIIKETEKTEPQVDNAFLQESFKNLSARWVVASEKSRAEHVCVRWTAGRKTVTVPRFAFTALFVAAVCIPAFFAVKTTESRMESINQQNQIAAETERIEQLLAGVSGYEAALAPGNTPIYSTDFQSPGAISASVSTGGGGSDAAETHLDGRFTLLNSVKMFSQDEHLFSDGEYILIKLPEVVRFGAGESHPHSANREYILNVSQHQ